MDSPLNPIAAKDTIQIRSGTNSIGIKRPDGIWGI
jgi:hypothetical protein